VEQGGGFDGDWDGPSGLAPSITFAHPSSAKRSETSRHRRAPRLRPAPRPKRQAPSRPPSKPLSALSIALVAAIAGGLVGAGVVAVVHRPSSPSVVQVTVVHGASGPALAQGVSIPSIAARALSSVVTIIATGPSASVLGGGPTSLDEGTGMIIDTQGDILTNNHVVAGSVSVSVTLHGQIDAVPAYVVGTNPGQDIALVRLSDPPPGLVPVIFGESTNLQVGDAVVAIGDALGLSAGTPTVTSGIVSALGRTVAADETTDSGTGSAGTGSSGTAASNAALVDMIQTDAPINPGNSGGPLLNSAGQVIGMNTAVDSSNADDTPAQDIGFAIPAQRLVDALGALEKGAEPGKAMLGIAVISNTPELRSQYGLAVSGGAVVVSVDDGSPADNAGVMLGDVIVGYNSRPVTSSEDLQQDVQSGSVGQRVTLRLWRLKREITLHAVLESSTAAT